MGYASAFEQMTEKQQGKYREKIIDNHASYNLSQGKLPRADSSSSSRDSEKNFTGKRLLQTLQRRKTYGQALSIMSSFPQRGQSARCFSVIGFDPLNGSVTLEVRWRLRFFLGLYASSVAKRNRPVKCQPKKAGR